MFEFEGIASLEAMVDKCEKHLFSKTNRKVVRYRQEYLAEWLSDELKEDNEKLLKDLSGSANVYAIFESKNGKTFQVKYIGQTKQKGARTRLTNHLIKKHEKTGAKLQRVMDSVRSGNDICISWVQIEPESLRHYVEEKLIEKHSLEWNVHGQSKV
ncbi:TPA: hypothetical protein ACQYCU_004485 [Vibrio parahaemolyticus]